MGHLLEDTPIHLVQIEYQTEIRSISGVTYSHKDGSSICEVKLGKEHVIRIWMLPSPTLRNRNKLRIKLPTQRALILSRQRRKNN